MLAAPHPAEQQPAATQQHRGLMVVTNYALAMRIATMGAPLLEAAGGYDRVFVPLKVPTESGGQLLQSHSVPPVATPKAVAPMLHQTAAPTSQVAAATGAPQCYGEPSTAAIAAATAFAAAAAAGQQLLAASASASAPPFAAQPCPADYAAQLLEEACSKVEAGPGIAAAPAAAQQFMGALAAATAQQQQQQQPVASTATSPPQQIKRAASAIAWQQQMSDEMASPRFFCPFPGCKRSFAELWRLKVHYRAPPNARGDGVERGHGCELGFCPRCGQDLVPGKPHKSCSAGYAAPRQAAKRRRVASESNLVTKS